MALFGVTIAFNLISLIKLVKKKEKTIAFIISLLTIGLICKPFLMIDGSSLCCHFSAGHQRREYPPHYNERLHLLRVPLPSIQQRSLYGSYAMVNSTIVISLR